MNNATNPFNKNSSAWHSWEHRFERLQLPNGELHAWHCWCTWCDIIKHHCPNEYKIIIVDDPSDPLNLYPYEKPIICL